MISKLWFKKYQEVGGDLKWLIYALIQIVNCPVHNSLEW